MNNIFPLILILISLFCHQGYGQDSEVEIEDAANDKDITELGSVESFVIRRPFAASEHVFDDEIEFLQFILAEESPLITGEPEIDGVLAYERFIPILEKARLISNEIAAKRKQNLTDPEREQLAAQMLNRIENILPVRSICAMRQCEILVNGPVRFLQRRDNRRIYNISESQLASVVKTAQKQFAGYEVMYQTERRELITEAFKVLTPTQTAKAEQLFGLPANKLPSVFNDLPEKEYTHVARLDFGYSPNEARRKNLEEEYLRKYSEHSISILYAAFSSRHESEIREQVPLLNVLQSRVKPVTFFTSDVPYDREISTYRVTQRVEILLQTIHAVLSESAQTLADEQEKEYDLMMNGTGEIDGIVPKEAFLSRRHTLTYGRLRRKLLPFAESLTATQQQTVRDVLLMMFGPTRILLCQSVSEELEIDAEQRLGIIKNALAADAAFATNIAKAKQQAFLSVLSELTEKQQEQLSQRVGLTLTELARRYSLIGEKPFESDFSAK